MLQNKVEGIKQIIHGLKLLQLLEKSNTIP
jgi:hypothetical protein